MVADIVNGVLLEHGIDLKDFKRGHMYWSQESHLETRLTKIAICLLNKLTTRTSSFDQDMPLDVTYKISGTEYTLSENNSTVSRDFVLTQQLPEHETFSLGLPEYLSDVSKINEHYDSGIIFLYFTFLNVYFSKYGYTSVTCLIIYSHGC